MLRENFYEEQGAFFYSLGSNMTPTLKTIFDKMLTDGKMYDEIYFENFGWMTRDKTRVDDPAKYKKMDEW